MFELLTSDFLFAPEPKEHRYTKDDDHMAQIIELLGDLPPHRKFGGKWSRDIFNSNGQLHGLPGPFWVTDMIMLKQVNCGIFLAFDHGA